MANISEWSDMSIYNGKKPFIFISYAHKDANAVLPVVKSLENRGYRVWLDLGIEAGTEWANNIASHLKDCAAFVVFISKNSMASEHCLDEIAYAKSHQKPSLMVFLEEDVEIPEGIEMQTARFQRMYKSRHADRETFVQKICEASFLEECRDDSVNPELKEQKKANKKLWVLPAAISVVLAIAVAVMGILMFQRENESPQILETLTEAVEETEEVKETVMSDNLLDFTVKLNGVVYAFPCDYNALTDNGWTISTNNISPDELIFGESNYEYYMANSGSKLSVRSYNSSGNARAIKDCSVAGITFYFDEVDFEFPYEINADSTKEDIINAYGAPTELNARDGYDTLVYRLNGSYDNYVKFTVYNNEQHYDYSTVTVYNCVNDGSVITETNTERPQYLDDYKAPESLGDDVTEPIVKISGDLYRLPAPISAFTDNGWKIVSKPGYVVSGGYDFIDIERNGEKLNVRVDNYALYQTVAENCFVPSLTMYASDGISLEIPAGITLDSTKDDVANAYDGFTYYDGLAYNYSHYIYTNGREFSVSINVNKENEKVGSISIYEYSWQY